MTRKERIDQKVNEVLESYIKDRVTDNRSAIHELARDAIEYALLHLNLNPKDLDS